MSKAEATLLDYLRTDKKYGKISDRYAKMRYAVERYSKMMARYGKFNLEQCALYERDHTKDVEVVALEQRAIEQILAKHDADEGFSAEEYKSLLKATNNLLRHLPIDWSDWPWMLSVLKLYLSRAEIEFDRKLNRAALSDLRHATGVLKHFCLCELCQLDTATATNTLKCQAPDRQCLGPLVPNDFRACLLCGHEVSKSDCDRLVARGKKASDEFSRVINKIYHPDTRTKLKVVLNAVGIGRRSNLKVDAADQDFLLGKMDDVLLTAKQIAQLERQLVVCTEVFYGGSYHLLEKCILLLKVYRDANLEERSLTLIAPLTRSVGAILPSRTDCTLVKLPRMLDYAASFYEEFALKCRSLPTPFWELFRLLNDKLLQVLQFDLNYRGHFFPISQLRLDKNVPIEELQEHEDVCFDAEEHNFRQLYRACRRRLNALDAAANEETTSQQ